MLASVANSAGMSGRAPRLCGDLAYMSDAGDNRKSPLSLLETAVRPRMSANVRTRPCMSQKIFLIAVLWFRRTLPLALSEGRVLVRRV
jgi:hypothetical protein